MESCNCSVESVHEGLDLNVALTRARFEMATQGHLLRVKEDIFDLLEKVGVHKDQIHMVGFVHLFVGDPRETIGIRRSRRGSVIIRHFKSDFMRRSFCT